jgi:hypothetical protein
MTIKYRDGLKYQLIERATFYLGFSPPNGILTPFIQFKSDGTLILEVGYACDGCSGPTRDDETNIQGGFVHDAGYQLMRLGLLPVNPYKNLFDNALKKICLLDGMGGFRAEYYFEGVHLFGGSYAARQQEVVHTCGKVVDFRGRS